jgi:hypothetical protein
MRKHAALAFLLSAPALAQPVHIRRSIVHGGDVPLSSGRSEVALAVSRFSPDVIVAWSGPLGVSYNISP